MVLRTASFSLDSVAKVLAAFATIMGVVWGVGWVIGYMVLRTYGQTMIAALGLATTDDIARIEGSIAQAAVQVAQINRQIVVLSRPDDIAHYRDAPRATGEARAGEPVAIYVFAERDPRALDCRIVPDATQLLVIASDGREYIATRLPVRAPINLPAQPRAVEPVFQLPRSVPPGPALALIRSSYTDCPWQINGEPPAMQDSPPFPMEIIP